MRKSTVADALYEAFYLEQSRGPDSTPDAVVLHPEDAMRLRADSDMAMWHPVQAQSPWAMTWMGMKVIGNTAIPEGSYVMGKMKKLNYRWTA